MTGFVVPMTARLAYVRGLCCDWFWGARDCSTSLCFADFAVTGFVVPVTARLVYGVFPSLL